MTAPLATLRAARERPVIFTGESVRAILSGAKTQTRRLVKPQPSPTARYYKQDSIGAFGWSDNTWTRCPYGAPGDRLWVRETWLRCNDGEILFRADVPDLRDEAAAKACLHLMGESSPWRSPLFLRRDDARIALELTAVRVERLQEISEGDALAEGFAGDPPALTPRDEFSVAWEGLHEKKGNGWDANPWVWVLTFAQVKL